MNLLEQLQQQYIEDFSNNVPFLEFLLNLLVVAVLVWGLRAFYIRYGDALSNRRRFANTFLPLALGTLLIIMIVKSSIALSLGLVGALSIVRFRAAIKDPEELTYLFIAIGLGLAGGANQPVLAVVAFVSILLILFFSKKISGQAAYRGEDRLFVNITTDLTDVARVAGVLTAHFSHVELKRLDTLDSGLDLSFICKAKNLQEVVRVQQAVRDLSPATRFSMVDQPDLIL